jgi:replicative DNA helicase
MTTPRGEQPPDLDETLRSALRGILDILERLYSGESTFDDDTTGSFAVEDTIQAYVDGQLIAQGGESQVVGSGHVLTMARNLAGAGTPVTLMCFGPSQSGVAFRLLCIEAEVDYRLLASGQVSLDDWRKVSNAVGSLAELPIRIVAETKLGDQSSMTS